jgi:hypothetical protein
MYHVLNRNFLVLLGDDALGAIAEAEQAAAGMSLDKAIQKAPNDIVTPCTGVHVTRVQWI